MTWKSGSNKSLTYNDLSKIISDHISKNGSIKIGTDSMLTSNRFIFVNAICLTGKDSPYNGKFFYKRFKVNDQSNKNLMCRLLNETTYSINLANKIKDENIKYSNIDIEIHLDVNENPKHLSYKYSSAVIGYALGFGYTYKVKPNSYAASCVADKFTRPSSSFIKKFL